MWLKEGDRNTRFFHKMAKTRTRRNHLSKIRINGGCYIEDKEMKAQVVRDFQGFLLLSKEW